MCPLSIHAADATIAFNHPSAICLIESVLIQFIPSSPLPWWPSFCSHLGILHTIVVACINSINHSDGCDNVGRGWYGRAVTLPTPLVPSLSSSLRVSLEVNPVWL
ncbi:hypothetical protein AX774_g4267 [Zancudomyces culisetae]|uniref:Uncharacterized protein n=1 Tax=Zancudomyces culisetae TaxID=1213189 RepID=A0A1R1PMT6_ZANCU|nr:hypothetical protein AX774_g4267 [Zancudomyces culisetae]|eukprot:OMH82268.1 hypothetical protein AX774_g4267 [Zancudomyces culisetae]